MNKHKEIFYNILKYGVLLLLSLVMIFPFVWMLTSSLKEETELIKYPPSFIPSEPTLENYKEVLRNSLFFQYFNNSLIVSSIETVIVVIIAIFGAYGFYCIKGRWKDSLLILLMTMGFLPYELVMIYNYRFIIKLGLNDTLLAVFLPFCCNISYTFILYNAFKSIPPNLYNAACMDKASSWCFLWKIAVPYVKQIVIFIVLMNFISSWNSFLWPLMVTNSTEVRTLPFGLYSYTTEIGAKNGLIMAFSCLSEIPPFVIFVIFRRYFIPVGKRKSM